MRSFFATLFLLASVLQVHALLSHRPTTTASFEQVQLEDIKLKTGDLAFWQYNGTETNGEKTQHMGMGMVIHLPDIDQLMMWEPVVYAHNHLTTGDTPTEGGAVRLVPFSHALGMSGGDSIDVNGVEHLEVYVRQIDHPSDASYQQQLTEAVKTYWKQVERIPNGFDLKHHGTNPQMESAFCAWTITATYEALGFLEVARHETVPHGHFLQSIGHFLDPLVNDLAQGLSWREGVGLQAPKKLLIKKSKPFTMPVSTTTTAEQQKDAAAEPQNARMMKTQSVRAGGPQEVDASSWEATSARDPFGHLGTTTANFPGNCDAGLSARGCDPSLHIGVLEVSFEEASELGPKDNFFSEQLWIKAAQHPRTTGYAHLDQQNRHGADFSMPWKKVANNGVKLDRVWCMCVAKFPEKQKWFNRQGPQQNLARMVPTGPPIAVERPLEPNYMYEMAANDIFTPTLRMLLIDIDDAIDDTWGDARFDLAKIVQDKTSTITQQVNKIDEKEGRSTQEKTAKLRCSFKFQSFGVFAPGCTQCQWEKEQPKYVSHPVSRLYFDNWSKDLLTGDFITFKGTAATSEQATKLFGLTYSHAAIAYKDTTYEFLLMYHAILEGVLLMSLRHYAFSGQEGAAIHRKWSHPNYPRTEQGNKQRLAQMLPFRKNFDGKPYNDFWGTFKAGSTGTTTMQKFFSRIGATNNKEEQQEDLSALFCSELAAEWYQHFDVMPEFEECNDARLAGRTISCNSEAYQPADFLPRCRGEKWDNEPKAHAACGGLLDYRSVQWNGKKNRAGLFHWDCPELMLGLRYSIEALVGKDSKSWVCSDISCDTFCRVHYPDRETNCLPGCLEGKEKGMQGNICSNRCKNDAACMGGCAFAVSTEDQNISCEPACKQLFPDQQTDANACVQLCKTKDSTFRKGPTCSKYCKDKPGVACDAVCGMVQGALTDGNM